MPTLELWTVRINGLTVFAGSARKAEHVFRARAEASGPDDRVEMFDPTGFLHNARYSATVTEEVK